MGEVKVRPKLVSFINLELQDNDKEAVINKLRKSRAYAQAAVVDFLSGQSGPISLPDLKKSISCTSGVLESLRNRGIISVSEVEVRRDPLSGINIAPTTPPAFTAAQQSAWQTISQHLSLRRGVAHHQEDQF